MKDLGGQYPNGLPITSRPPTDVFGPGFLPGGSGAVTAVASAVANGADTFRASGLRGMHTDNIVAGNPRDAAYVELFSRSRSNVTRRFIDLPARALGQPYTLSEALRTTLLQDLASFAAIGCQTILVLSPTSPDVGAVHAQSSEFWADTPQASAARAAHVAASRTLAEWLVNDDRVAGITFFNEPWHPILATSAAFTEQMLAHQEDCIDAVRAADPTRTCVVTCAWFGAPGGFTQMRPVRQDNVAYEFHFYQPYEITHANVAGQPAYAGTYPSTAQRPFDLGSGLGTTVGAIADKTRMEAYDLSPVISFARQYGVPIWVGEFTCGMMNGAGVAVRWIQDAIDVFQKHGWSWNQFGFWFPSNPWSCFELPNSSQLIDFNNGTTSGQAPLSSFTGGSTEGRTPFAVVAGALRFNKLFRDANPFPKPALLLTESFEGPLTVLANNTVGSNGTAVADATSNPKSGTRHARCTRTGTGTEGGVGFLLGDLGVGRTSREYAIELDVRLGQAIQAGETLSLLEANTNGEGSGAYWRVLNVAGTNNWQFEMWRGSGDYGARPFINITGLTFPVGTYVRLRVSVRTDPSLGRIRVWADDKLLIDINHIPTCTTPADYIWRPAYGAFLASRPGQFVDFDNVVWVGGERLE